MSEPGMPPIDWQERVQAAVAATLAARQARRDQRAEFDRRRAYGLKARHAAKLRLIRDRGQPTTTEGSTT